MSTNIKKIFDNQPPVPYSIDGIMGKDFEGIEPVLVFKTIEDELCLNEIRDFPDERDTLVIPDEVEGKNVVETSQSVGRCYKIRNIYIPKTITNIAKYSFEYRDFNIVCIDGVKEIGEYAFKTCRIQQLILLDGTSVIHKRAFIHAKISNITMPNNYLEIYDHAFAFAKIRKLKFSGESVDIYNNAFEFSTIEEINFCSNENTIIYIGESAFESCHSLKTIDFGQGAITIHRRAFADCINLTELTLKEVILDGQEFDSCERLRKVTVEKVDSYGRIRMEAFSDCYSLIEICNKANIDLKDLDRTTILNVYKDEKDSKLKYTEDGFVFYEDENNKILVSYDGDEKNLLIPKEVTEIWNNAFLENKIVETIFIPNTVKTIGYGAFALSKIKSIQLEDNSCLETINGGGALNCDIESFVIPDHVKYVGEYAFGDKLKEIKWGRGCRNILKGTFENCTNLEKVILPDNLQFIDDYAFEGCTAIKELDIPKDIVRVSDLAFYNAKVDSITKDGKPYIVEDIPRYRKVNLIYHLNNE